MEINTQRKRLNESLSKREVTFCHEISIMHKLCSLNGSVTHIVNNDFPLSSEKITAKNSFDSKYLSQNYLSNLPEAVVVLENIPEALLHKHGYVNKNGKWCQLPTVQKISKSVVNKKSYTRRYHYSLHNYNLNLVPWVPKEIEKAYKSYENDNAPSNKTYQENYSDVSFDNYPCIHLEKLDLGSNLESILNATDESCISASEKNEQLIKESVSKTLDLTLSRKLLISNLAISVDDKCLENNSNDESLQNCENSSLCKISQSEFPHILLEKLDLTSYSESISNTSSKKDVVKVRKSESCEQNEQLNEESLSQTVDLSLTERENEFLTYYSDPISSKDIDSQNSLQNLTDNLSMVYVDSYNGLENHSDGTSLLQIENTGRKETNCENSNCFKNAQNEFQRVVLEKFISPETDIYTNLCINASQPALCTNLAHDNGSDLAIQIESVCSISERKFNKIDHKKKPTRKTFSSRNYASDHSSSEDDIPLLILLKRKLINAHVICDSSDSLNDDNDSYKNLKIKKYRKKKKNCKSVGTSNLRKKKKLLKKKQHNIFIEYVRMHIKYKKLRKKYKKIINEHKNSANLKSGHLISQNSHDNVNDIDDL